MNYEILRLHALNYSKLLVLLQVCDSLFYRSVHRHMKCSQTVSCSVRKQRLMMLIICNYCSLGLLEGVKTHLTGLQPLMPLLCI